ncbi:hypothetical protein [Amycolatopsis sp. YIM 10]|uniref:hypothetical protein n=1 Tax=Amycolatopsis sp. YIM 10 TaxID=2653857 RepID=UPI0012908827|nr:hypothetical protein [Amycolatopsis sp. YIM 10]
MSTQELLEHYATQEQRSRVLQLNSLRTFLSGCIIENKYRVPDGLHTPLVLTSYGERISEKLRKNGAPFQESRLLCLLEMLGPEPLIDIERTNIDALKAAISSQVKNREIVFPFRFGRELYDKFNGLYDQEKGSLSTKETAELLRDIPQGVFQIGTFVCGPYGLLNSDQPRSILPRTTIPLQYCSDHSCLYAHYVTLSTGHDAPINEHRSKIARMLDRDGGSLESWISFFDTFTANSSMASESNGEPYIVLIGDALTDNEIRKLLSYLLDNTGGRLREVTHTLGAKGRSSDIAENLSRAQMLQLICVLKNDDIVRALDALISNRDILAPEGEVRTAVVNYDTAYGPYEVFAELSRLGIRLQSKNAPIAPLRLRQLVEKMYNLEEQSDRDELLWQLRAKADESVDGRLQRHLQTEEPRDIVERLTLARRSNVIIASEYLNFSDSSMSSDAQIVDSILWKLGYPVDTFPDINAPLFILHEDILLKIRRAELSPSDEFYEDLDSLCHKFWKHLENALYDSASYATWALTTDHFGNQKPFIFREDIDSALSLSSLNEPEGHTNVEQTVVFNEKPGMYALCRSFERLAAKLDGYTADASSHKRPLSHYPQWHKTELHQVFPFEHSIPFLDLDEGAQKSITNRLRTVSKSLISADASELRNATNHPRREHANLDHLRSSLESIREALTALEADGLCRLTYTLANYQGDAMTRQRITLSHRRGYQHTIYLPNSYSWLHLPGSSDPQYVMTTARIKNSTEVLRFTREVDSPYSSMYADYPKRPVGFTRERHADSKDSSESR